VAADVQDFAAVYKEAGITLPPHGYGVDRVAEMLQGKRLATLSREVRATAVLAALEAARVDVQDVIEDGIRRDKALDAFEAAKERELVEGKASSESRVQSLRKDLDELLRKINSEIEKLKQESQEAEAAFAQLQVRKRQEEARLHDVVAHFVEGANPISAGPGASGPADPAARS
jgi:chromosome segregation ATPase